MKMYFLFETTDNGASYCHGVTLSEDRINRLKKGLEALGLDTYILEPPEELDLEDLDKFIGISCCSLTSNYLNLQEAERKG